MRPECDCLQPSLALRTKSPEVYESQRMNGLTQLTFPLLRSRSNRTLSHHIRKK